METASLQKSGGWRQKSQLGWNNFTGPSDRYQDVRQKKDRKSRKSSLGKRMRWSWWVHAGLSAWAWWAWQVELYQRRPFRPEMSCRWSQGLNTKTLDCLSHITSWAAPSRGPELRWERHGADDCWHQRSLRGQKNYSIYCRPSDKQGCFPNLPHFTLIIGSWVSGPECRRSWWDLRHASSFIVGTINHAQEAGDAVM